MVHYKKIYFDYFGTEAKIFPVDEYEWVVNDLKIPATDIHHIEHGANKTDHINNIMALSRKNHIKAHKEQLKRDYLKKIHLEFMFNNPY